MNFTDDMVRWISECAPTQNLALAVRDSLTLSLCDHPYGIIDSHALARVVFERRYEGGFDPDLTQTKDYVQHVLRETLHVCRYAVLNHFYVAHEPSVCSATCQTLRRHLAPYDRSPDRQLCPTCYVLMTTQGTCSLGCDEE